MHRVLIIIEIMVFSEIKLTQNQDNYLFWGYYKATPMKFPI